MVVVFFCFCRCRHSFWLLRWCWCCCRRHDYCCCTTASIMMIMTIIILIYILFIVTALTVAFSLFALLPPLPARLGPALPPPPCHHRRGTKTITTFIFIAQRPINQSASPLDRPPVHLSIPPSIRPAIHPAIHLLGFSSSYLSL